MGGEEGGPKGGDDAALELVRVIDRTDFVSPTDYNREKEFVVRNNTDENKNYIFLPLGEFRINLEVYDEDGTKLNYFPNNEVASILNEVEQESEEEHSKIQERLGDSKYKLFVQLQPERPIGPDELRSIRITFGQSLQPQYHRIWESPKFVGWITNWKQKFFRIPSFVARANRLVGRDHSELFVVKGPSEYVTVAEKSTEHADRDKFYENGYGDDTRVLSTHLPPAEREEYTWKLNYDLVPNSTGLLRLLAGFWVTATGLAIALMLMQGALHTGHLEPAQLTVVGYTPRLAGKSISTGIISILIGIMYALRAEWAERYRILCIAPILLHGVSWFFWTVLSTSGG